MTGNKILLTALLIVLATTVAWRLPSKPVSISSLRFIGEYEIPFNLPFKGTTVGGLSGIDYDAQNDLYYLISDDRSSINPARFYSAKISLTQKGIDSVMFIDSHKMLLPGGADYPSSKHDPKNVPDPEAIRFNPISRQLVWTCEGERNAFPQDPSITSMDTEGNHLEALPMPAILSMHTPNKGPRRNGALEGLTFTPDYKSMYVSLEIPMLEDGPEPEFVENEALVRIFKYDVATKTNVAQYAYRLDPVAYPTISPGTFKVNGISDILAVDENRLLVVERSFSTGRLPCTIKVFIADLRKAENVLNIPSLKEHPPKPVMKKLLLNMDDLRMYTDNIEGVTYGPDLPNGHRTLLFVSDNNFLPIEKTQLLLFEIIP